MDDDETLLSWISASAFCGDDSTSFDTQVCVFGDGQSGHIGIFISRKGSTMSLGKKGVFRTFGKTP